MDKKKDILCAPVWKEIELVKKLGINTTALEDAFCNFECSTEHVCEHGGEIWGTYERYYAKATLDNGARWHGFAGRCMMIGIEIGWSTSEILDYIFESVHSLSLSEIPESVKAIREDMKLAKANS